MPPFTPPPAIQSVKPNGLWSRPSAPWANGVRPNSPRPDDERLVEQPALLAGRCSKRGDRLVDGAGVVLVAVLQVAVLVPAVVADARAGELDEPHAPLDQPAGEQALPAEAGAFRWSWRRGRTSACVAVGLVRQVHQVRARPSASGRRVRSWRWPIRPHRRGPAARADLRVELLEQVELVPLQAGGRFAAARCWRPAGSPAREDRALIASPAESRCRNCRARRAESGRR